MALSGNQITRIAAGGAGRAYAGFTAKAISVVNDAYHSLLSPIVSRGTGVLSTITTTSGILSTVTGTHGIASMLNGRGKGVLSTITSDGKGVLSAIKNTS